MWTATPFWLFLAATLLVCASASPESDKKYTAGRVIVELESHPLAYRFGPALEQQRKRFDDEAAERHSPERFTRLVARDVEAREHLDQMEHERSTFLSALGDALGLTQYREDGARRLVARNYDHAGQPLDAIYTITFHGMALRVPDHLRDQPEVFIKIVQGLPYVRNVARERRVVPVLFSSTDAINASTAYAASSIGGLANAGAGIKIASLDDGVYAAAAMFNGTGYTYPPGWNNAGRGDLSNCNGKVIVSKAFSVSGTKPSNPGPSGDSHGTFSASIAGGVLVNATIGAVTREIHGIAPRAWIMAYQVLEEPGEVTLIQGLEAAVNDGADIMINSWAYPPYNYDDGFFSPVDRALVNAVKAGVFLAMAAGNEGPTLSTVIHASDAYITVGATSKASSLNVTAGVVVDTTPFVVADMSCRGPSVLRTLKPDITAPGAQVMAQGYDPATKNVGFGVADGTSFATPMVAGGAALLKQMWPAWTPKQIKAAMMATARWRGVTVSSGAAAQPLDMGAGNLNLAGAINPGAMLDPPSLTFGYMPKDSKKTISVTVASVANTTQTFTVRSVFTGPGSAADYTTAVTGISFVPASVVLAPGAQAVVNVTYDSSISGIAAGDNQGFIVLASAAYEVHAPLWARVLTPTSTSVLILNAMGTSANATANLNLFTSTLTALGYNSTVQEIVSTPLAPTDLYWISAYPVVFFVTGNNGVRSSIEQPPTQSLELVRQYAAMGGKLFMSGPMAPVMAQEAIGNDLVRLLNFIVNVSATVCPDDVLPTSVLAGPASAPSVFKQISFTLLDTPGSRCLNNLNFEEESLYPREILSLVASGGYALVAGKRAQPSKQYQGRRFEFATVTSLLSLEMIPEASRVPFISAVLGYLTEDVSLNVTYSTTDGKLRAWLASSLSTTLSSRFNASLATFTLNYGDSTTSTDQAQAVEDKHCYNAPGSYNVTVAAVSAFGTGAVWEQRTTVTTGCGSAASLRAPLAFVLEWLGQAW